METIEKVNLIKKMGLTESDLDRMWKVCSILGQSVIQEYVRNGQDWRDLSVLQVSHIPCQYKRIVRRLHNRR